MTCDMYTFVSQEVTSCLNYPVSLSNVLLRVKEETSAKLHLNLKM